MELDFEEEEEEEGPPCRDLREVSEEEGRGFWERTTVQPSSLATLVLDEAEAVLGMVGG